MSLHLSHYVSHPADIVKKPVTSLAKQVQRTAAPIVKPIVRIAQPIVKPLARVGTSIAQTGLRTTSKLGAEVGRATSSIADAAQMIKRKPLSLINPTAMATTAAQATGVIDTKTADYINATTPLSSPLIQNDKLRKEVETAYLAAGVVATGAALGGPSVASLGTKAASTAVAAETAKWISDMNGTKSANQATPMSATQPIQAGMFGNLSSPLIIGFFLLAGALGLIFFGRR